MHPKQLENVFSMSSKERYEHFLIKVCDWEEVWVLSNTTENLLTICPDGGVEYLPVWPHDEYAKAFSKLSYSEYSPSKIDIYDFVQKHLFELDKNQLKIGVLPNLDTTVWIIEPSDLRLDLEGELEQHE